MQQLNRRLRPTGLLSLFACALALSLSATPALADENDTLDQTDATSVTTIEVQADDDAQTTASGVAEASEVGENVTVTEVTSTPTAADGQTSGSDEAQAGTAATETVSSDQDTTATTDDQAATDGEADASTTGEQTDGAVAADTATTGTTDDQTATTTANDGSDEQAESDASAEVDSSAADSSASTVDTAQETVAAAQADAKDAEAEAEPDATVAPKDAVKVNATGSYLIGTDLANAKVLTVVGKVAAGSKVISGTYANTAGQVWKLVPYETTSWYRIVPNSATSLSLEANGQNSARLVKTSSATDVLRLLWAFIRDGADYRLENAAVDGWNLDTPSASSTVTCLSASSDSTSAQTISFVNTKPAVSAGTENVEGAYNLTLTNNTRVVEVRGGSKDRGAQVWLWASNGRQHQKVYLERDSSGYYTVWFAGTGKVLDVKGSSILPGTKIIQWTYHGRDNQKWALLKNNDGSYRLVNKATGLVLGKATGSYDLLGLADNGATTNTFKLNAVDLLSAGIYRIQPRTTSATALDVYRASTAGGAKITLYKNNGGLNQRFQIVLTNTKNVIFIRSASSGGWLTYKNGKIMQDGSGSSKPTGVTWRVTYKGGWYSLINARSGKALDMCGGSTKSGTNLIGYTPNGRDSQHFSFVKANLLPEKTYYLTSAYGSRLDVTNNSTSPGGNVQTWVAKNTSNNLNQRFTLKRVGSGYYLINARSGLVVGASELFSGDSTSKSTHNVTQRLASGKDNQIWEAQIEDGGYVRFVNAGSGYALEVASSSSSANVKQGSVSAGSKLQKWKLTTAPSSGAAALRSAKTKILFVGNSFTFYQDLPNRVLSRVSGVEAACSTRGSSTLSHHLSTSDALGKRTQAAIAEGGWDYVVIQEMSTQSIDNYDRYLSSLKKMVSLVKAAGATPIIYGTWAFPGGSGSQGYGSVKRGISNAEMHAQLQAAFTKASKETGVAWVNTGKEIARSTSQHAAFDDSLYCDRKHLSVYGANLAAAVFAQFLKSLI